MKCANNNLTTQAKGRSVPCFVCVLRPCLCPAPLFVSRAPVSLPTSPTPSPTCTREFITAGQKQSKRASASRTMLQSIKKRRECVVVVLPVNCKVWLLEPRRQADELVLLLRAAAQI